MAITLWESRFGNHTRFVSVVAPFSDARIPSFHTIHSRRFPSEILRKIALIVSHHNRPRPPFYRAQASRLGVREDEWQRGNAERLHGVSEGRNEDVALSLPSNVPPALGAGRLTVKVYGPL